MYGGLDPSLTLLLHGLESDWIEEEMADDDDFRFLSHSYIFVCFENFGF